MSDTLVPEPQASIFDSVTKALGNDEDAARRVMLNPNLAKGFKDGKPVNKESKKDGQDICGCGNHADACGCSQPQDDDIPLKAVDDIGRATAADVKEPCTRSSTRNSASTSSTLVWFTASKSTNWAEPSSR